MSGKKSPVMRVSAWLMIGVACALVTACGKNATQEGQPASTQFPGFQQVGGTGDAAQLWFNPSDIARSGSGYVIHALKAFPHGYARFDVLTNCRDSTRRLTGTQYRADGSADQEYPGNDGPVLAKSEPGISELMGAACGIAMASRAIPGEFNVSAALELLYGPYDEDSKVATWPDASVPPDLPWRDNLVFAPGKSMSVTGVATFEFSEGGKQKKVLVTNAVPDGGGCHACTALLGVAIFVKDGGNWKVESNSPYVASMGAMGSVGDRFKWLPAGDDSYALVVNGEDMHQGYATESTDAFLRSKNGTFSRLISDGDTGESDQEGLSVETIFLKGKNPAHYDIKVSLSYELQGQPKYIANHIYQYSGGKYVLVRKDDPPKFVLPAPDGSQSSVAAPSVPGAALEASQQYAPGAPAAVTTSFDCSKARSDAEHLICSDPELAADDVELAKVYSVAKAAVADQAAFKERTRNQWNYREKNCHDRECLVRWYADQKIVLTQIAQTGKVDGN